MILLMVTVGVAALAAYRILRAHTIGPRIAAAVGIVTLGILGFATIAHAHHVNVTNTAPCRTAGQPWTGTISVTFPDEDWSAGAGSATVTATVNAGSVSSAAVILPGQTATFDVTGVPEATTTVSYTISTVWTNQQQRTSRGSIDRPPLCPDDDTEDTTTTSPPTTIADVATTVADTTTTGEQTTTSESAPTTVPASETTTPASTTAAPTTVAGPGTTISDPPAETFGRVIVCGGVDQPPCDELPPTGISLNIAIVAGVLMVAGLTMLLFGPMRRPRAS